MSICFWSFAFFSNINFSSQISQLLREPVFEFCIHLQRIEVYCVKESHNTKCFLVFCSFFCFVFFFFVVVFFTSFTLFSIAAAPGILKPSTNIGYDNLYSVR